MTSRIRVEYVRSRRTGDTFGMSPDTIQQVLAPAEYYDVSAASQQSAAAPTFADDGRGYTGGVFAKISVEIGAVIVTLADVNPTATDLNGVRLSAGDPPLMTPIDTGKKLAFIEAASGVVPDPVVGVTDIMTVTLSLDATTAYADGDVLADTQQLANAVRENGGTALLQSVTVLDKDDIGQAFDLVFLDANNSLGTENVAPNISDANATAILAAGGPNNALRVAAGDYIDLGGCRVATKTGLGVVLKAAAASRDLWLAAIIRGAGAYSANGLVLRLAFLKD